VNGRSSVQQQSGVTAKILSVVSKPSHTGIGANAP
jgi:hypothetical protein